MILGHFTVSDHFYEQYNKRCKRKPKDSIRKSIGYDLRTLNIRKIVYSGDTVHVFTYGFKEFIFFRKNKMLILRTFIKRNFEDTEKAILKRQSANLITS